MAAGARVGLGGMLLATLVALRTRAASSRARAALIERERELQELRARLERVEAGRTDAERGRDRLQGQLERSQVELRRRRELVERLTRARRAEREFNLELREQLEHAHRTGGSPGDADEDVRELVLRAAIALVGAEKGLLLARTDADRDGDLDLVTSEGFEHDPEHSVLVQRFAHQVLERDEIVREDTGGAAPGGDATAADEEIENLVAIPLYLLDHFHGVVVCANRAGGFAELDDELLLALGDHASAALRTEQLKGAVSAAHRATLRALAAALEARDPMLRREAGETAMLARLLCRRLELGRREEEVIASAALIHDIGHLAVPDRVLLKPGPLSADERAIIEMHPRVGHTLLSQAPALSEVALAVLHHHERFDGGGYPIGLAGDAIPVPARVLAIVDAYTAMLHDRPFRPRRSPEEALEELTDEAGGQFDPEITAIFIEEARRGEPGQFPAVTDAVASALDTAGLSSTREDLPMPDPLTLLPGHRDFREAAQAATRSDPGGELTIAIVELDELESINRRQGYGSGDHAIVLASRCVQRAALRCGGTAYRVSGRRFGLLVSATGTVAEADLAAELHTEFAVGPSVRVGIATQQAGETMDDVVTRARAALVPALDSRRME
jgi:HD-GYP domain-containing protein (c-di-GMP phosphodiesterase class II)